MPFLWTQVGNGFFVEVILALHHGIVNLFAIDREFIFFLILWQNYDIHTVRRVHRKVRYRLFLVDWWNLHFFKQFRIDLHCLDIIVRKDLISLRSIEINNNFLNSWLIRNQLGRLVFQSFSSLLTVSYK